MIKISIIVQLIVSVQNFFVSFCKLDKIKQNLNDI